jgi:UDP-3-O-acyl N-acetylglucosamine deacetylase
MKRILIVDDEAGILQMVSNLLVSAGFEVVNCQDPARAMPLLEEQTIDLVLLDIWMPGIDGHTVLKNIRTRFHALPVIIFSGHANLNTTLEISKSGADDFIEKPFSGPSLLAKIRRLLQLEPRPENGALRAADRTRLFSLSRQNQCTLARSGVMTGKGLHTGTSTGIIISPAGADTGIVFEDITSNVSIPAIVENVASTSFTTNLNSGETSISCVEHLLAALHVFGVDNAAIKVNKEIPIMDGSAAELCSLIRSLGVKQLSEKRHVLHIERSYSIDDTDAADTGITISPYDGCRVDYLFEQPDGGPCEVSFELGDDMSCTFCREIAPARTFGYLEELRALQSNGLGQGGDMQNFIMLDGERAVNTDFRFPDEPARHKVLDIIGDFGLLGVPWRGHIKARRTGHRHNISLVRQILGS